MAEIGVHYYEKLHYPSLLDWEILESCSSPHLLNCAKNICQLVVEFNGITRGYQRLLKEQNSNNEKYNYLLGEVKKSNNCNTCTALKTHLHTQTSKFRDIASTFECIASSNLKKNNDVKTKSYLQKAHVLDQIDGEHKEIFTQAVDSNDIKTPRRKTKTRRSPLNEVMSPKIKSDLNCQRITGKKACLRNLEIDDSSEEIEETIFENLSPIIKKGKSIRTSKIDAADQKIPRRNLTEEFIEGDDHCKSKEDDGSKGTISDSSTSFLYNLTDNEDSSLKDFKEKKQVNTPKKIDDNKSSRYSLSLLQKKCKSNKNYKNLKQSRLAFVKSKPKLTLDISQSNSFGGGLRNSKILEDNDSAENKIKPDDLTEKTTIINENIDVIEESPSCVKRNSPNKSKKIRNRYKNIENHPVEVKTEWPTFIEDNDATLLMSPQNLTRSEKICLNNPIEDSGRIKKKTSPNSQKVNIKEEPNNSSRSPLKNLCPEYAYKEEAVRKKADKMKLQGWSCTKCRDFYSVAFKGNDKLLQEKISECSKHRGKFNPERSDTPPGFWNMDMPSTLDTEAFNRRNYQSQYRE